MSVNLNKLTSQLALFCLVLFVFVQCSSTLPTAFRNRLFDMEASDTASPEFARPDEADLQRNSARLHRTLFLLDTSDLLKNARLFGEKASKPNKEGVRAKRQTGMVIRVRKPTLTFHDSEQSSPSLFDAIEELRKSVPV